jgi:hypothetical protein
MKITKRRSVKKVQSKSKRRSVKKIQSKSKRRSVKKVQSKSKKRSIKKVKSKSKKRSQSGGRKSLIAVLAYGSKDRNDMNGWCKKLRIKKEKGKRIEDDFISLINKYGLTQIYLKKSNQDFPDFRDKFSIGFNVKDYDNFSEKNKSKVDEFYNMYKLTKPTFYCGILEIDA